MVFLHERLKMNGNEEILPLLVSSTIQMIELVYITSFVCILL